MAKNNNLTDFLTAVAGAIRTKKGTSDLINPQNFESEISSIKTEKPEQEKSVSISTNGTTEVTPDSGKVLSKVSVTTNVQPTLQEKTVSPTTASQTITPDSGKDGLSKVTISAIQTEEKIQAAGTSNIEVTPTSGKYLTKVIVQPTPSETKTVIPTTDVQTITPTSGKYISKITVEAVTSSIDSNIVAENIKKDVSILGVTGTLESGSSGTPIDVATEEEMASILSNATADDNGKIYRYTGTTGMYANGALYWLEVPEQPVEPSTDELAGTWVFNDTLDYTSLASVTESTSIKYNFTSNGNVYLGITTDFKPNGLFYITGLNTGEVESAYVASTNTWTNEAYKTITITSKLSEVTNGDALLTWLQANATKQGASNGYNVSISSVSAMKNKEPVFGTKIKFDLSPTSDDDYDFYVNSSGVVTGNSSFENKSIIYAWAADSFSSAISINGNETIISNEYNRAFSVTLTGDTEIIAYYHSVSVPTPTLISFTIGGTSYQAEEGMTWEDWVNSDYNTDGYYIEDASGYVLIMKQA